MVDFLIVDVGHTFIMRDPFVIEQVKVFVSQGKLKQTLFPITANLWSQKLTKLWFREYTARLLITNG